MEKLTLLFEEFLMKAIVHTEAMIESDFSQSERLSNFTENRDRLLMIVGQIAQQIDWNTVPKDKREDLNRRIDYIKKLDEKLLTKLQEYQQELKKDIERTHRSKENIKGYNLTDVK